MDPLRPGKERERESKGSPYYSHRVSKDALYSKLSVSSKELGLFTPSSLDLEIGLSKGLSNFVNGSKFQSVREVGLGTEGRCIRPSEPLSLRFRP